MILSISASGSISMSIAAKATAREIPAFRHTQKVDMKTAVKQAMLPAAVFPFVKEI